MKCIICQNPTKFVCTCKSLLLCPNHIIAHMNTQEIHSSEFLDNFVSEELLQNLRTESENQRHSQVLKDVKILIATHCQEINLKNQEEGKVPNDEEIKLSEIERIVERKKQLMDSTSIIDFIEDFGVEEEWRRGCVKEILFSNDSQFVFVCKVYLGIVK